MHRTPFQPFCSQGQNELNVVNENPRWRTARWALRIQTRLYRSTGEKVRQASLPAFQMYFGTCDSSLWRQIVDMLEQHRLDSPWFEACVSSPLYLGLPKHLANPKQSPYFLPPFYLQGKLLSVITAAMATSSSAVIFVMQCFLVPGARITGVFFKQTIRIIPIILHQAFLFQNCG